MKTFITIAITTLFSMTAFAQFQYRSDDNSDVIRSILEDRVRVKKVPVESRQPVRKDTRPIAQDVEVPKPEPDTAINQTIETPDSGSSAKSRTSRQSKSKKSKAGKTSTKKKGGEIPPASGSDKVLLETGIGLFDGGNDAAAIDKFRQLKEKYPSSPYNDQASVWLAKSFLRSGRTKEALAELEGIGEDSGEYPSALFLAGQIYRDMHQADKAIEQFFKLSSRFPGSDLADDALIAASKIYLSRKQGTLALTAAAQVVKQYPDRETLDDAYFQIGMVLEKDPELRDIEKARLVFRKFVQRAEIEKLEVFAKSPLLDRVKKEIAFIEKHFLKTR